MLPVQVEVAAALKAALKALVAQEAVATVPRRHQPGMQLLIPAVAVEAVHQQRQV